MLAICFTLKIRLNAAQNLTFTFLSLWGVPMIAIALRLYAVANMQWQSWHRLLCDAIVPSRVRVFATFEYTKTYFYISINFISITNVQTTSKTWAKTRGNAAQFWILSFFVLDVKFRRPKIQNDKKQTLAIWFQLENTNCILDIKIISKNKGKCCCFFNFAILAS